MRTLIERFRALPSREQAQIPAVLYGLGKLELAAGETQRAQRLFGELAERLGSDRGALAEARPNQFRAALATRDWDAALTALRQAVELDPARFAPLSFRKYEPQAILGAGGFGVAYCCRHRHIDSQVVIKALHAEELGQGIAEIFREGRPLKSVSHPAVVRVEDCDYADARGEERPYLVMEYFPGEPLDGWLARHGPLPPEELPALARPLAEGMRAAHAAGVLHRDLKPENLLARREGGWQVKIIDFGLALRQSADPSAQEPALAAGTLHFAPPEQLGRRPEPVGTYSDVYAFGKTLAYCLFLRTELLRRDWRTLEEALPGLAEWIERCLEEEPARRFQDFDAVLGGLAELDESQRTAAIPPPPAPAPRPSIPAPVAPVVPAVQANPAAMTYRQYKER